MGGVTTRSGDERRGGNPVQTETEPTSRYIVTIHGRLPLPNETNAMGLRARLRLKKGWRTWAVASLRSARVPALGRARVTFTRHSSGTPDTDAVVTAFKYVQDALVLSGVIDDDDPSHLRATYRAARCQQGRAHIDIEIEGWDGDGR